MSELFAIVAKGDVRLIAQECIARGLTFVSMHPGSERVSEFVGTVSGDRSVIAAWFAEDADSVPGYGYPQGTLLHYRSAQDGPVIAR